MVRLRIGEGKSINSLIDEYGISKSSIMKWCKDFRNECQISTESQHKLNSMNELRKLKKEMEELRKENQFLKKAAAFFAKEIGERLTGLSKIS